MNRREILFRGKALIGGEWIYGGYTYDDADKDHMITQVNEDGLVIGYVVDPSTVGQYTGLTDSKGNKVFEGDIVKGGIYTAYEIKWDSYRAEFNTGAAGLSVSEVIGTIHDKHLTKQS